MTLKEAIQKDGQTHLYVNSAIISGTTQYHDSCQNSGLFNVDLQQLKVSKLRKQEGYPIPRVTVFTHL